MTIICGKCGERFVSPDAPRKFEEHPCSITQHIAKRKAEAEKTKK